MNSRDSPDPPNSTELSPEKPDPPPAKIMPKRKRKYSRSLTKGAPDAKRRTSTSSDPPSDHATTKSASIRSSISSQAASRKLTKTDLENEVTLLLSENAELQTQLDAARKLLSTSESKRAAAIQSQQAILSKSREYKKTLSSVETVSKKQATQLSIAKEETEALVQEQLYYTVHMCITLSHIHLCFRIFIREVLRVSD